MSVNRNHDGARLALRRAVRALSFWLGCTALAVMAKGRIIARGHTAELIDEHAGDQTAEVYGPPERLAEVRAAAEAQGLMVRAAGPAVAIVGSERARDGAIPAEAVIRAATLEDVFVLLTGEEAE